MKETGEVLGACGHQGNATEWVPGRAHEMEKISSQGVNSLLCK